MWFLVSLLLLEFRDWLQQEGWRWTRSKVLPCRTKKPATSWGHLSGPQTQNWDDHQIRNKNQIKNQWVASKDIIWAFSADNADSALALSYAIRTLIATFLWSFGVAVAYFISAPKILIFSWFNEVFCAKQGKHVCPSFIWLAVTAKDWI